MREVDSTMASHMHQVRGFDTLQPALAAARRDVFAPMAMDGEWPGRQIRF
jgi:hypothetical protein